MILNDFDHAIPTMHATEFLRNPPDALPCVVALVGDEQALKGSAIRRLTEAVLDGDDDAPTRFTGKDTDMKSVRDELLTISMWSDRRVVIVDESTPRSSVASDVAALCVDQRFDSLQTPVKRVTAPHCPVPFSRPLEQAYLPSPAKVLEAVRAQG